MLDKNNVISKLSLGIFVSVGLVACGGGSSSTEEVGTGGGGDEGEETGSGGCVSFPRPVVGQKIKLELKSESSPLVITTERLITAFDSTSIEEDFKVTTSGITTESKLIENFTIANNYRDITKSTITTLGITSVTTNTPYERVFADEVCEGQTLSSTFTETTTPGNETLQRSVNYIIEAVNVSKTTAAGTFNTFRVKTEESDTVGTSWIDIATGVQVFGEFEDINNPATAGTLELVEFNQ
jgi:hypothetical protein